MAARRIALVATRCAGCGTVKVYWRGKLVRKISLDSAIRVDRAVIPISSFASVQRGTLVIRVVGGTGRVLVDGLVVRR